MNMTANTSHCETPEAWKAVVLYTDAESGSEAQEMLTRVAARTGTSQTWTSDLWRFDVMAEQLAAGLALQGAQDAQLILLSARSITEPPEWLLAWLGTWAAQRSTKSAAIAAWCRHSTDQAAAKGIQCLRDFAHEHGITFLCADDYRDRQAA